ncbi:MAG: hypothetical protein UIB40_02475 [Paludibacteraceae bacterium]|nr:hypothetical protein [Paludibacteraceae bacterium]
MLHGLLEAVPRWSSQTTSCRAPCISRKVLRLQMEELSVVGLKRLTISHSFWIAETNMGRIILPLLAIAL